MSGASGSAHAQLAVTDGYAATMNALLETPPPEEEDVTMTGGGAQKRRAVETASYQSAATHSKPAGFSEKDAAAMVDAVVGSLPPSVAIKVKQAVRLFVI
jgi:hypothetical protein